MMRWQCGRIFIASSSSSSAEGADLPAQHQVRDEPEYDEEEAEHEEIDPPVAGTVNAHLVEEGGGLGEVARVAGAGEHLFRVDGADCAPVEAVHGQHRAFEGVTHVGHVREPLEVLWNDFEADKEAAEQENRNGRDGTQKYRTLKKKKQLNFFEYEIVLINQSINHSIKQSTTQTINHSNNQTIKQSFNQPISQSTDQSIERATKQL